MEAFRNSTCLFIFALIVALRTRASNGAEFVILGEGRAYATSADGSVIAGNTFGSPPQAWRWTADEGISFLTPLSRRESTSVRGLSSDGTIVGGASGDIASMWTADDAPLSLEALPGDNSSWVWNVSAGGEVIVGDSWKTRDKFTAFRWTSANGIEPLGPLPGDIDSAALGVSADGSVVVGQSRFRSFDVDFGNQFDSEGTVWMIQQTGEIRTIGLGKPNGQDTWARFVSRDGSTVVGGIGDTTIGHIRGPDEPFRWSESAGMEPLGLLNGLGTTPTAISHDASVIVGNTENFNQNFVWDQIHDIRNLQLVLNDEHGVDDLLAWDFVNVEAMSDDARVLAGQVNRGADGLAWALFLDRPLQISLSAGDANQDLQFDQRDVVQVLASGKYLTGQPATWGEGDWNAAPNIRGDRLFNQLDIVAAQQAGLYLTGPYAAVRSGGQESDGQTSVVYHPVNGEIAVDAPAGAELTSINIDSAAGIFTGDAAQSLGGSFDNDADNNIFKATFGGSFGSISFGNVAQAGLSEQFVLGDLSVVGSLAGGGDLGNVDLVYVPEPTSAVLLAIGLVIGISRIGRSKHLKGVSVASRRVIEA